VAKSSNVEGVQKWCEKSLMKGVCLCSVSYAGGEDTVEKEAALGRAACWGGGWGTGGKQEVSTSKSVNIIMSK